MTTDEQYVPSEGQVRAWCREGVGDYPDVMDEWLDRFLARVRRDAAREALKHFRRTELAIIPLDADEDSPIRVRQQALAWRIEMHLLGNYPEETP